MSVEEQPQFPDNLLDWLHGDIRKGAPDRLLSPARSC